MDLVSGESNCEQGIPLGWRDFAKTLTHPLQIEAVFLRKSMSQRQIKNPEKISGRAEPSGMGIDGPFQATDARMA